ncbi:MAG TPA: HAMP domain-containing protein [Polyangiaceae bacterium]|nr:HAMP domain-containing protein [Polyangiaceae bacterium]
MSEASIPQASPAPRGSLRIKFIRTMLLVSSIIGGVTLAIVLFLSARSSAQQLRAIEASIEEGITSKGKVLTENHALALHGMVLDNAFLDMQTLLARAVSQDPDLVYGLFVNSEGEALAFQKRDAPNGDAAAPEKDAWRALGLQQRELVQHRGTIRRAVRLGQEVVEVAEPVFSEEHEILGTIRYGLSTRRMRQALSVAAAQSKSQQLNSIALIGATVGLATLLGILLSRVQAVRITKPVQALTQAAIDLAGGKRSVHVSIDSGDELQVLGHSFNRMVDELSHSYRELEEMNRTLEHKVEERTLALAGRNRDMRLVLDNVDQGFITLTMKGVMAGERSAVIDRWFGAPAAGRTFWQYLALTAPDFALGFEFGWDQLIADVLPHEVALEQLPSRLNANGSSFSLRYIPLLKDDRLEGVLVSVADITSRLQREREEADLTEMAEAFRRLMLDRTGFLAFANEAGSMVKLVCSADQPDGHLLRSTLHTLKGNSAQMGLKVVAQLCHTLEDELATGDGMKSQELLAQRWQALSERITQLVGDRGRQSVEVSATDYAALVELLSRDGKSAALTEVLNWRLEPASRPLGRLAEQARALALRLGKGNVEVDVQASAVRLDPEVYGPFFSDLVHLVRNAIDHGIEGPEERAERGKPALGKMTFKVQTRDNRISFEIADDGRGIDWAAITQLGASLGMPSRTPAERIALLCRQGVTTRSDVSETSGRGVGMSAIKQRIDAMHGRLEVESSANGTKWTIVLPWASDTTEQQLRRSTARSATRPSVAP